MVTLIISIYGQCNKSFGAAGEGSELLEGWNVLRSRFLLKSLDFLVDFS